MPGRGRPRLEGVSLDAHVFGIRLAKEGRELTGAGELRHYRDANVAPWLTAQEAIVLLSLSRAFVRPGARPEVWIKQFVAECGRLRKATSDLRQRAHPVGVALDEIEHEWGILTPQYGPEHCDSATSAVASLHACRLALPMGLPWIERAASSLRAVVRELAPSAVALTTAGWRSLGALWYDRRDHLGHAATFTDSTVLDAARAQLLGISSTWTRELNSIREARNRFTVLQDASEADLQAILIQRIQEVRPATREDAIRLGLAASERGEACQGVRSLVRDVNCALARLAMTASPQG